jgi:SpoVK/Ycf46/Vps4 family AAA+-type ATPase
MINLIEEKIIIKKKPQMAAGMNDIKSLFMSSIIVPIRTRDRKNRPFSFFLYGPSGNGKSMIVRNLCAESEITLFEVTMKGLMRYHAE